jgi:hypothetical protein
MFVELLRPMLMGQTWHPAGVVLQVDRQRGKTLVDRGVAVESQGPELLEQFPAPVPSGTPREPEIETATGPPAQVERTASRTPRRRSK